MESQVILGTNVGTDSEVKETEADVVEAEVEAVDFPAKINLIKEVQDSINRTEISKETTTNGRQMRKVVKMNLHHTFRPVTHNLLNMKRIIIIITIPVRIQVQARPGSKVVSWQK